MTLRWWHAAALLVAVSVIGSPRARARRRVLLVGDSLAVGLGAPARADGALVSARGGTVARQWITRGWFVAALESARPDLVLVSLGTNDATGQIDAGTFAAQAAQLEQLARARGARLVWLFPPVMPFSLEQIRAGLARAEIEVLEPPDKLERAPDRIHLTPQGSAAWWRAVAPAAFGVLRAPREAATTGRVIDHEPGRVALWHTYARRQPRHERFGDRTPGRSRRPPGSHCARGRSHRLPSRAHETHVFFCERFQSGDKHVL